MRRADRALRAVRNAARSTYRHRLTIWVVAFTAAVSWSLWAGYRIDEHQRAADRREATEDRVEEAQACIRSWQVREDIRDAIDVGVRRSAVAGAEALISIADDADQATIDAFRAAIDNQVDLAVAAARDEIANPDCDLEDAHEVVE